MAYNEEFNIDSRKKLFILKRKRDYVLFYYAKINYSHLKILTIRINRLIILLIMERTEVGSFFLVYMIRKTKQMWLDPGLRAHQSTPMQSIASVRPKCLYWGLSRFFFVNGICKKSVILLCLSIVICVIVEKTSTGYLYLCMYMYVHTCFTALIFNHG